MKAQAYPFTGKGQQTQSICITDTKSTSNNKASVKTSRHPSFCCTFFGHLPILPPQKEKNIQNEVNFKHRFTYTYMLVEDFLSSVAVLFEGPR